jgi:hypothetical protein
MKYLKYIILVFMLSSCFTLTIETYLTADQKKFFLYQKGANFSLLKDNIDTIDFEAGDVTYSDYEVSRFWDYQKGVLNFKRKSLTKSKYWGGITISSEDNYYSICFQGHCFAYNDTIYTSADKTFTHINDLLFIGDKTINNKVYHNVYFIYEGKDTLYFSKEKGIIYLKFNYGNERFTLID